VVLGNVIREGFTSLFQYGVFDSSAELQVVILEIGAGGSATGSSEWTPCFASPIGKTVPLELKAERLLRRQCWISGDPTSAPVAGVIPFVGEDRFFWASDFPHADHPPDYVPTSRSSSRCYRIRSTENSG